MVVSRNGGGRLPKLACTKLQISENLKSAESRENLESPENVGNLQNLEIVKGNADMAATAHLAVSTYIWHRLFLSGFLSISNTFDTYFFVFPTAFHCSELIPA